MDKTRFVALDSWRGLAALLVALFHFRSTGHIADTPFILNSWLFVDFFFVLSGFVISHSYFSRLSSPLQLRQFVIQRFGRLYPLHAAILGLFILSELFKLATVHFAGLQFYDAPFTGPRTIGAIFTNLLMIHSLGIHTHLTWNEPSWSISVEFFVYLVFAAIVLLTKRPRLWLIGTIAGSAALIIAFTGGSGFGPSEKYGFFRALYGFAIGHFVWMARLEAFKNDRLMALFKRHSSAIEFATSAASILFVIYLSKGDIVFAAPFVFGLTILAFSFEAGLLSRVLTTAPFRRLGDLSYSIYMVHGWMIWAMGVAFGQLAEKVFHLRYANMVEGSILFGIGPWTGDLLTLLFVAAVFALSNLTYEFIEKPGRDYFKGVARRLPAKAAPRAKPATTGAAE